VSKILEYSHKVCVRLLLSRAEVNHLVRWSAHHPHARCSNASRDGHFLSDWGCVFDGNPRRVDLEVLVDLAGIQLLCEIVDEQYRPLGVTEQFEPRDESESMMIIELNQIRTQMEREQKRLPKPKQPSTDDDDGVRVTLFEHLREN
jgi:hypothetical protein